MIKIACGSPPLAGIALQGEPGFYNNFIYDRLPPFLRLYKKILNSLMVPSVIVD